MLWVVEVWGKVGVGGLEGDGVEMEVRGVGEEE